MASTANKVTYGLCNVHWWPITATDDSGVPTYGTAVAEKGAKEISLDAEGDTSTFYADNVAYYISDANNGYKGKLTLANVSDAFLQTILGMTVDKNGVLFETSDKNGSEFAMAFEFEGDANKVKHVFYRCKASRPSVASKTKEDKVDPNTQDVEITIVPRLDTHHIKAKCSDTASSAYADWYGTAPYVYVATV